MNLGRKFWSCENQSCNLTFEWIEDEVPERSRRIISGLLNAKANLELQVEKSKKKEKRLWVVVIVLVLVMIFKDKSGLC